MSESSSGKTEESNFKLYGDLTDKNITFVRSSSVKLIDMVDIEHP